MAITPQQFRESCDTVIEFVIQYPDLSTRQRGTAINVIQWLSDHLAPSSERSPAKWH